MNIFVYIMNIIKLIQNFIWKFQW